LTGLQYAFPEEKGFSEEVVVIQPTGDPSFMHEDYSSQPVMDFLRKMAVMRKRLGFYYDNSDVERWGNGWSWNDYDEAYMAERNVFPIYGNVISMRLNDSAKRVVNDTLYFPLRKNKPGQLLVSQAQYFDSLINVPIGIPVKAAQNGQFTINRSVGNNYFVIQTSANVFQPRKIPFVTNHSSTTLQVLRQVLQKEFVYVFKIKDNKYEWAYDGGDITHITINKWQKLYSRPTDSLLKPMMHRSDNFFAEQSLLMVSNEFLGEMNDRKVIDTLLKTDFRDLPQKPRWADGSGLSRYNLFTPDDFVIILDKIQRDFGMKRVMEIFPTGGEGTLSSYYKNEAGKIFAKTGTLSGVVALSGYLYTKKGRLLLFSVLVNNHQSSATEVRKAVEQFITGLRDLK
jgi:D-alanyl-D-alanine carboxypeptidase/D-alanyl-D-alanine-endopeptidase (penicillin-binding protein 4)